MKEIICQFLNREIAPPSPENQKLELYIKLFQNIAIKKTEQELVIGMGNEDYEIVDKLESIAKSLESMAESQKRMVEVIEMLVQEKGVMDLKK
ncbi:hypothetical protein [Methanosarcina horonobensis]|nr:hypothetical protein [Methanosarcina horonobensis]